MSDHTSEPWRLTKKRLWANKTHYISVMAEDNTRAVANVWACEGDDPEAEANAYLIAAAPDLLAALTTLLNATNDVAGLKGCSERDLALRAVNRAKGIELTESPFSPEQRKRFLGENS